jgi:hypothetical protein
MMITDEEPIDLDADEIDEDELANYALNLPVPEHLTARQAEERTAFIEKLMQGVGPYNAGIALGWSPYKVDQLMRDQEFVALLQFIESAKDEKVETALYRAAASGVLPAIQMWLHARRPDRWLPTKKLQIERHEQVDINIVHSVREAARALLAEHGPAALQPGGALDDILDADVIDDDVTG